MDRILFTRAEAVQRGDIVWHAFPFNAEAEMYDADIYASSVSMSQRLAQQFGVPVPKTLSQRGSHHHRAIALPVGGQPGEWTDVPGLTRSTIPLLSRLGVKAISIGANSGSAPAAGN